MDVGALRFFHTFTEREKIYNLIEALTGRVYDDLHSDWRTVARPAGRVDGRIGQVHAGGEHSHRRGGQAAHAEQDFHRSNQDVGVITRGGDRLWPTGPNLREQRRVRPAQGAPVLVTINWI